MPRLAHAGAAVQTTLTASLDENNLSFTIADSTGWVFDGDFVVALTRGFSNEEKVRCSGIVGTTVAVAERGFDGTTPHSHAAGDTVLHVFSAVEAEEASAHIHGDFDHETSQPVQVRHGSSSLTRLALRLVDSPTIEMIVVDDALGGEIEVTFHTKTYVHTQASPASTWTIDHNLDGYPSVRVFDSANDLVIVTPQYPSTNRVVLSFLAGGVPASMSGRAHLSN